MADGETGLHARTHGEWVGALERLLDEPATRRAMGAASRELVRSWGYEPSIETLVRVVRRIAAAD